MLAMLRDNRVPWNAPVTDFNLVVGSTDPLQGTFERIRQFALNQTGPIDLEIICHGFETHRDTVGQQSVTDAIGGSGLQLCAENLTPATVGAIAALKDAVSVIKVHACSAAETRAGYEGSRRDGQALFKRMSALSGAIIYASDTTQSADVINTSTSNSSSAELDVGAWEGNVFRFSPDGSVVVVESNPT
jgi:hypothetical protein